MSAMTGIIAGVATLAGAVALYRLAKRRARDLRAAIGEMRKRQPADSILDFEQDPDTGVYRAK